MMLTTDTTVEVLQDLVALHNDRIKGYERAIKELETGNTDLAQLFESMLDESKSLKSALERKLVELGNGEQEQEGATIGGKLYRAWMDVKAAFSGNSRKAVLESCEFGEDKAQDAYQDAMSEADLLPEVRQLLTEQQRTLLVSHNRIKALRNTEQ